MKNVKDEVYKALSDISDNTSDNYPSDWANFPAIQYVEEENKVYERTNNKEDKAYIRYKIDIWHNKSTSETALAVDEKISALGLVRISCTDIAEAGGLKHKLMRYEGIIDMNSNVVYWNN